ncbi:UAA transporter family-domain-containing protein [Crassisporium funariophilum]|nr:UAA transporter family-domain-containing protein [Crassisporium funariophilum]
MLSLLSTWITTISLIFGGCCSNAITLEQITLEHPNAGSVLTFFQFLLISLHGLPKFVIWTRFGPRFRPRRVPITNYLVQVVLFYLVSLLNNAAFAYRIPMAVHIIFRSGGLIISMLLGWLVSSKRYSRTQILSVLLVTAGVIITTLSASQSSSSSSNPINPYTYATGIGILTLALVFSGLLGLTQDWVYSKHGRPALTSSPNAKGTTIGSNAAPEGPPAWQESMFYLHFLALPMLLPLLPSLAAQMHELNTSGPRAEFSLPLPISLSSNMTTAYPLNILPPYSLPQLPIHFFSHSANVSLLSIAQSAPKMNETTSPLVISLSIPHIYLPLVLNTITQLLCVAGVHRLTTRVSALSVTLVLVVRKAVSLMISVVGVAQVGTAIRDGLYWVWQRACAATGLEESLSTVDWAFLGSLRVDLDAAISSLGVIFVGGPNEGKRRQEVDTRMMWTGATLVLLGTIGYTIGSRPRGVKEKEKIKGKTE